MWRRKYSPPVDAESTYIDYLGQHFKSIVAATRASSEGKSISFDTLLRWKKLDSFMKYGSASIQLIASIWTEIVGSTRDTCDICKFKTIDDLLSMRAGFLEYFEIARQFIVNRV